MSVCMNPARDRHDIADGGRRVTISVDWGDDDLRDGYTGDYTMCSFKCLAEWASERAGQHDGRVVKEGTP